MCPWGSHTWHHSGRRIVREAATAGEHAGSGLRRHETSATSVAAAAAVALWEALINRRNKPLSIGLPHEAQYLIAHFIDRLVPVGHPIAYERGEDDRDGASVIRE